MTKLHLISIFLSTLLISCASSTTQLDARNTTNAETLYEQAMAVSRLEQAPTTDDMQAARSLLVKSAAQDYMPAIHALGWMELRGIGIEKDEVQAFQHFRRAALAGYAESQYMLGVLYSQGWGVEPSSTDSLYWIRKAADQGQQEAQAMLRSLFTAPTQ